eukprot:SAG25_NODE_139_length_14140_cov_7.185101_15_plen_94_part_01
MLTYVWSSSSCTLKMGTFVPQISHIYFAPTHTLSPPQLSYRMNCAWSAYYLVYTGCRRHGVHLIFVQGMVVNGAIADGGFALVATPAKGMLHPI